MLAKTMSLNQAAGLIEDGMLLALGGSGMHRTPTMFSMALAGKPVRKLKICGAVLGLAADILFANSQADTAYFGFFGLEEGDKPAPGMRKAIEGVKPKLKAIEGS